MKCGVRKHFASPWSTFFLLLLTLGLNPVAKAQFGYTKQNGAITITAYNGSQGSVVIPNTLEGLPVTQIGAYAFYLKNITSVVIPKHITNISEYAFAYCSKLTRVVFLSSPPQWDGGIFYETPAIVYYFPGTSGWIDTFGGRPARARLDFTPSDFDYGWKDGSITIFGYQGSGEHVVIPATIEGKPVTRIASNAFQNNHVMTSLTAPNTILHIGDNAFDACDKLNTIFFAGNTPTLGTGVFNNTAARIVYSPKNQGWSNLFGGNFARARLDFTPSDLDYGRVDGGITIFGYTGSGGSAFIPSTLESLPVNRIANAAFIQNTTLSNVFIPSSVADIGAGAFVQCSALANISVDTNNVHYCSSNGVLFNSQKTSLIVYPCGKSDLHFVVPETVLYICDSAFFGCDKLNALYFLASPPTLGIAAFSITRITVVHSSLILGWPEVFGGRPTRSRLDFAPSDFDYGRTDRGITIFSYTGPGGNVTIPNSLDGLPVRQIGVSAFAYDNTLQSISVPDTVENIDQGVFYECSSLKTIFFQGKPPIIRGGFFGRNGASIVYSPLTSGWTDTFGGRPARARLDFTVSDFDYGRVGGSITIFRYRGTGGNLIVPTTLDGLSVTQIADSAFNSHSGLINVTIPNTVTNLGSFAFSGCSKLRKVFFGGKPPSLGAKVFDSTSASIVYLPEALGWTDTFGGRPTRSRLDFTLSDYDYGRKEGGITIFGYAGTGGDLVIPGEMDGLPVTRIADSVFFNRRLTNVVIPDRIVYIGRGAFAYNALTSVTIPSSVTFIDDTAFGNCYKLATIFFQGKPPGLGAYPFEVTHASVVYSPLVSGWTDTFGGRPTRARFDFTPSDFDYGKQDGGITIFGYTGSQSNATIPGALEDQPVDRIATNAFKSNRVLTSLTIPESVTNIGRAAFYGSSLTMVFFHGKPPSVGFDSFGSMYASVVYSPLVPGWTDTFGGRPTRARLDFTPSDFDYGRKDEGITIFGYTGAWGSVVIPNALEGQPVTRIATNAFNNNGGVTNLTIPGSVIGIGGSAFYGSSLSAVLFEGNAPSLGPQAFGLTSAKVFYAPGTSGWPDTFGGRPARARLDFTPSDFDYGWKDGGITIFGYAGTDGSVVIPGTLEGQPVTRIAENAFRGNRTLTSVTIPSSVTSIEGSAFSICASLATAFFKGNAPAIGTSVFAFAPATVVHLPNTAGWTGMFAGRPTLLWNSRAITEDGTFGLEEGRFGFTMEGPAGLSIVVEACDGLGASNWFPISTNTFDSQGKDVFNDPNGADRPGRFYRFHPQ